MKIILTIEQLEELLWQQKNSCKHTFEKLWKSSGIRAELLKLDPEEKILNQMHEVRDLIPSADFPEDFNVLKKYNVSN